MHRREAPFWVPRAVVGGAVRLGHHPMPAVEYLAIWQQPKPKGFQVCRRVSPHVISLKWLYVLARFELHEVAATIKGVGDTGQLARGADARTGD
jgi:hypothetical protein